MGNTVEELRELNKLRVQLKKLDREITEITLQLPEDFDLIDDEVNQTEKTSVAEGGGKDKQRARRSYMPSWAGAGMNWNEAIKLIDRISKSPPQSIVDPEAERASTPASEAGSIDEIKELEREIESKQLEKKYLEESLQKLRSKGFINENPSEDEIKLYQAEIAKREPISPPEVISDTINKYTGPVLGTVYNSRKMVFKSIMEVGVRVGFFNDQNSAGFKTLQFLSGGNYRALRREASLEGADFFVGTAVASKEVDGKIASVTFEVQSPENRKGNYKDIIVNQHPGIVNVSKGGTYFIATPGWKEKIALMDEETLRTECQVDAATDYYAKRRVKEITGEIVKVDAEASIWVMLPLDVRQPRVIKFLQGEYQLDKVGRGDIVTLKLPGQDLGRDNQRGLGH